MSITSTQLTIRDLEVDVHYQDIKNLHIGVYPPAGRVRVAAPSRLDDDQVRLAVIKRLPWIRKQRSEFEAAPRQSERELVAGESHYVWGVRRRLKVVERPGRIHFEVDGDRLVLYTPVDADIEMKHAALDRWHRALLRTALSTVIADWEERLDVSVPRWSIRRMKTKWGSCNRETRHLWFNLELVKKPPRCLEYIVAHEMVHYTERNHGERFTKLMDQVMPDWRTRRDELNAAPLADEML